LNNKQEMIQGDLFSLMKSESGSKKPKKKKKMKSLQKPVPVDEIKGKDLQEETIGKNSYLKMPGKAPVIYTVRSIVRHLRTLIRSDGKLNNVKVEGEISNFRCYSSGHCYFDLKEENDILPGVMFARVAKFMDFKPEDGMQVIARGNVDIYTRQFP